MNWNPFEIFMIMSFLYVKKKIQHPFQCDATKIKSSVSNSRVCYEGKKIQITILTTDAIWNCHYK